MGRRDDADVDVDALWATEPLDLALLQDPQQLDLDIGRQVADLVEEDRRVIGQFEASDLSCERTSKRALLPAEQLALHQRAWNRRAVDPHHDPATPRAQFMNLRGDELLARAGLAEQQDGRIGDRDLLRLLQNPLDRCTASDNEPLAEPIPHLEAQILVFRLKLLAQARRRQAW